MKVRTLVMGILIGVGAFVAPPMVSAAGIYVNIEPPALRHEEIPTLRHGYVWAPGYWNYRSNKHVWVSGRQIRERRGQTWNSPRWEQDGTRWHYREGNWDRNGDGRVDSRDRR
jgi:WXXGXW repeat (2 copies)